MEKTHGKTKNQYINKDSKDNRTTNKNDYNALMAGLPDSVISIIKRHIGGGIIAGEAEKLGWPEDVYVPISLEEKIVSYADKLVENSKRAPIEITIEKLSKELKSDAAERVRKLYDEITNLIGDDP